MNGYRSLDDLLRLINEPDADRCRTILTDQWSVLEPAQGSTHNHQAWAGGYLDHVREVMNLAVVLYPVLDNLRTLPFTLSDALTVLFLHDLEKPWRETGGEPDIRGARQPLATHVERQEFRLAFARAYDISLTPAQENAIDFVEGESDRYDSRKRQMEPLASFCHVCDNLSARLWYDRPRKGMDEWSLSPSGHPSQ